MMIIDGKRFYAKDIRRARQIASEDLDRSGMCSDYKFYSLWYEPTTGYTRFKAEYGSMWAEDVDISFSSAAKAAAYINRYFSRSLEAPCREEHTVYDLIGKIDDKDDVAKAFVEAIRK